MPLYEYLCEEDGTVIELIRPMAQADEPVQDPEHKGRVFRRQHSTFSSAGGGPKTVAMPMGSGGCCPCGKNRGACSSN